VLPFLIRPILYHRSSLHAPHLSLLPVLYHHITLPSKYPHKLDAQDVGAALSPKDLLAQPSCNGTFCDAAATRNALLLCRSSSFREFLVWSCTALGFTTRLRIRLMAPIRVTEAKILRFLPPAGLEPLTLSVGVWQLNR
jgi:hypothetical protein